MSSSPSMAPHAANVAARLHEHNPRYAALPLQDVVDAAELLLVEIALLAVGTSSRRLDRHLRRIVALRVDQQITAADIGDAFSELRTEFGQVLEDTRATLASRYSISEALDTVEARTLQLLYEEQLRHRPPLR